jgi:hypothetical protein
MYGTQQAARCWWKFFSEKVTSFGFTASDLEQSLYYCKQGDNFVVIWLHVDNGFAMGSSQRVLDKLHQAISRKMEVKWSNSVIKKLVGINIQHMGSHTRLDQSLLVDQIINNYSCPCYPRRSTLPEDPLVLHTGDPVDSTD